jgi:hypothetical protein
MEHKVDPNACWAKYHDRLLAFSKLNEGKLLGNTNVCWGKLLTHPAQQSHAQMHRLRGVTWRE